MRVGTIKEEVTILSSFWFLSIACFVRASSLVIHVMITVVRLTGGFYEHQVDYLAPHGLQGMG
jgi:hypothetical protein